MAKGGTQTTETRMSPEARSASLGALNTAQDAAKIGYIPYQGNTVAAFTPLEHAAAANTADAAKAFGMAGSNIGLAAGLPKPTVDGSGVSGYSGYGSYTDQLNNIPQGQMDAIRSFFMNPQTGAAPTWQAQTQQKPSYSSGRRVWDWGLNGGQGGYRTVSGLYPMGFN